MAEATPLGPGAVKRVLSELRQLGESSARGIHIFPSVAWPETKHAMRGIKNESKWPGPDSPKMSKSKMCKVGADCAAVELTGRHQLLARAVGRASWQPLRGRHFRPGRCVAETWRLATGEQPMFSDALHVLFTSSSCWFLTSVPHVPLGLFHGVFWERVCLKMCRFSLRLKSIPRQSLAITSHCQEWLSF